jgi:hypothetical protein
MRAKTINAVAVLVAGAIAGHAQQPAQTAPTFRAGTDVVVVPVTVTDRSGHFVHGLTSDHLRFQSAASGAPLRNSAPNALRSALSSC